MKKKMMIGLAIALGLSIKNVDAQFSAGVSAGFNFSNFNGNVDLDTKMKAGVAIGGFAAYTFTHSLDAQIEALYSRQGAKEDGKYGSGTYNFNYIQLPLTAKYKVWKEAYVITGPQVGFLLSAKTKGRGETTDIKEDVKSTDLSWMIGAGYELPMGLRVDLRFTPGLADISRNSDVIRNTGFRLTFGYRLWKNN